MPANSPEPTIFIGETPSKPANAAVQGEFVSLAGETCYKIQNYDAMEPFFMSIVSGSDHWLFIASTGGLTAGRVSAEQALFPYYTVDKITENSENTGSKAIFLVERARHTSLWEPFSERQRGIYRLERNLYKNIAGTMVMFEEHNHDLGLSYRYAWRTGEKFGFVKSSWLQNHANAPCRIELLDGIQNILPANVTSQTQNTFSSLLDAYKRSELEPETGLGMFALNSTLTDLAEPSESLLAVTVFQTGLEQAVYLLSSMQLERFRSGAGILPESEVRGRRGAYFVHTALDLAPLGEHTWHLAADVSQDSAAILGKLRDLRGERAALLQALEDDLAANRESLWKIVASADGVQLSRNALYAAHHFANVMFNVMRGGTFTDGYRVNAADFSEFAALRNRPILEQETAFFADLPGRIQLSDLQARALAGGSADLIRLTHTYLPLSFSRRHGDPSRPWNRFAINIKKPDGSLRLDYEGNWRDIFQNWEALACAYPEYIETMISTFLNATTVDGYNPYRLTYQGLDWEIPEPGNPWANIGYWSDHQIIYLQKLMEISVRVHPGRLKDLLARRVFSYAHVPYQIKPYAELLKDPYNTIIFDRELQGRIEARLPEIGSDGKLVLQSDGRVLHASLGEKLLTLLLAKLANFVPEGGIWMNTQRPEWNDANNALVGKGLSVVTLCYLRRTIAFCRELFSASAGDTFPVNAAVLRFFARVRDILARFRPTLQGAFSDEQRRAVMDALGTAGSEYRWDFYNNGLPDEWGQAGAAEMVDFLGLAQAHVEHALRANQRSDNLYHAYNILHLEAGRAAISRLVEMLEGQVAMLSSEMLSGEESLALLLSLRNSALYRADQHSYILYPDRELPGFLEKNRLTREQADGVALFAALAQAGDQRIVTRDLHGDYHFSGHIRNARNVRQALEALGDDPRFADLAAAETEKILALFEATFHHDQFTGRSSTFFAYEGLGSIYWHMISKLLLAAQETALRCRHEACAPALIERYMDIRAGLGFNKSPGVYGAFPADPYSHTPRGQGAKQPGMTGMVKEEILTRLAELGLTIENGRLTFDGLLLDRQELLASPAVFTCLDVHGQPQAIETGAGALAYTFCQTPILLSPGDAAGMTVHFADGSLQHIDGNILDEANSRHIFRRDGAVRLLSVSLGPG